MTNTLGTPYTSTDPRRVLLGRATAAAALAGAAMSAVAGAIQAVRPNDTDPRVDGVEHVLLTFVAVGLVLWIPGYLALGRAAGGGLGRAGSWSAVGGTLPLAFAMTSSNLHGEDFSWFPAVAAPANALWAIGSVLLAVLTYRRRLLPRALAAALPLIWVGSIPLSQLGGNLVAAALWAAIGWLALTPPRQPA